MNGDYERVQRTMPVKPWGMLTKNNCPFCTKAKELLDSKGIEYAEYNIEEYPNAEIYRETMRQRGWETVPQIFEGGTHIGGYNDLVRYFAN